MAYTAIDDPSLFFNILTSTGDGGSQDFTGLGFQPDLVWSKRRETHVHQLYDSVRTAGSGKALQSDSTAAEGGDGATYGYLDSFDSDGFGSTVGSSNNAYFNVSSATYVFWCWKESAAAGFDIVQYTGSGSAKTEAHSLSAVPQVVIVKYTSSTGAWITGHAGMDTTLNEYVSLNTTAAKVSDDNVFNDTAPTSSVFSLGTDSQTNQSDGTYIAYLWSEKQGFSKFGNYEGNGNADGTFVYTGFRPAYVMTKSIDSTSSWHIFDNKREGYNKDNDPLIAEDTTVEATTDMIDLLSNGFKFRITTDPNVAETYMYMAFAEAPFVNSEGVPCNAR